MISPLDKLTREAVLFYAPRWKLLKAWGCALDCEVKLGKPRRSRLGLCKGIMRDQIEVNMRPHMSMSTALSTLLHELAHSATPGDRHGPEWRNVFAKAVQEVTGVTIEPMPQHVLDEQARCAISAWLLTKT